MPFVSKVPDPMFENPMYTVPEDDPGSVPLCLNISVQITEPIEYTIVTSPKSPPDIEGKEDCVPHFIFLNGCLFFRY